MLTKKFEVYQVDLNSIDDHISISSVSGSSDCESIVSSHKSFSDSSISQKEEAKETLRDEDEETEKCRLSQTD